MIGTNDTVPSKEHMRKRFIIIFNFNMRKFQYNPHILKMLTKLACTPLITKITSNFELTLLNYTHFELTFNNIETHFSVLLEYEVEVEVDFNIVNSSSSFFVDLLRF